MDEMNQFVEKLKDVKKNSKIYIQYKDIRDILEFKYKFVAKNIFNDKLFLVVETERIAYDEDAFFGSGEYTIPELKNIYLSEIEKIFTSEEEKNDYLQERKMHQKGFEVKIRFINRMYDDQTDYSWEKFSKLYTYFSENKYYEGNRDTFNFETFIVESCKPCIYGDLYNEMKKKNLKLALLP